MNQPPEPTIDDIREAILAANLLSEIPEKKRTEKQCRELDNAQNFLREEAITVMDLVAKPVFNEILYAAEGDKESISLWRNTLELSDTKPPRVTTSALNGEEFSRLFKEVYGSRNTIGGMYERTSAMLERFEEALKSVQKICRASWGFEKPTKADALFEAMMPAEVAALMMNLRQYNEQFRRRSAMLDDAFDGLIQLKHVNLGTPNGPFRITDENTPEQMPGRAGGRSAFAGRSGSRFPGGSRPSAQVEE